MPSLRKFSCGEADYLRARGIEPRYAARFDTRYSTSEICRLVEAGVTPEHANDAESIEHLLSPQED